MGSASSPAEAPSRPVSHRVRRRISARAAEVRCFDYELKLGKVLKGGDSALGQRLAEGTPLHGSKRLTYGRCANPWHQLTRMKLAGFPGGTGREVCVAGSANT